MQNTVVYDGDCTVEVTIGGDIGLDLAMDGEVGTFTVIRGGTFPAYTGETVVTPLAFASTVLETANKTVYSDIEVLEIPYTETTNPSGGITVSIG